VTIHVHTPTGPDLRRIVDALRWWQDASLPVQLHPGDVGWFWRFGVDSTAAALRAWTSDEELVAVGLLDGPDLLRVAFAPPARDDALLADAMAADLSDPDRGVLPAGRVSVETPTGVVLPERLDAAGWLEDDPWTPLRRDLSDSVPEVALHVEVVDRQTAAARAEVQRAAFDRSTFSEQLWLAMASGTPYADARCLLGRDDDGRPVAAATVWSAGPGRPGLLEPVGVGREHRGRGYGTAITLAAATALRNLGACCADVVTPGSNAEAIATYSSAGFQAMTPRFDRYRSA
jgi:ribosomal protein S18 acetylase RimI-like enzyme